MKYFNYACAFFMLLYSSISLMAEPVLGGELTSAVSGTIEDSRSPGFSGRFLLSLSVDGVSSGLRAESTLVLDPEAYGYDASDTLSARLETGELYGMTITSFGEFRIGWQTVHWGNSLAIPVLDIVCPQDYRFMFTGSGQDNSIPVPMVRWRRTAGNTDFEALYSPQSEPSRLPDDGRLLFPADTVFLDAEGPRSVLSRSLIGFRVIRYTGFGDLGISILAKPDNEPVYLTQVVIVDGQPVLGVQPQFTPLLMGGFDAAVPVGSLLFRTEMAVTANKAFSRTGIGSKPKKAHEYALLSGLEWMSGNFRFIGEYSFRHISGYEPDFAAEQNSSRVAGEISLAAFNDTCHVSISGFHDLAATEWFVTPQFEISPSDGSIFRLGAHVLHKNDGMLQLYDTGNRYFFEAVFAF